MRTPFSRSVRQSIRRGSPPVELDLDSVGLMALIWDIYDEMVALGMIPNRIEIDSGRLELDYVIPRVDRASSPGSRCS